MSEGTAIGLSFDVETEVDVYLKSRQGTKLIFSKPYHKRCVNVVTNETPKQLSISTTHREALGQVR